MRWSSAFIPTLRDDPADAEAVSHKLLVRAGLIRQLMAGHYSLTPLGFRTLRQIEAIIREEMDKIGGQEFRLPCMHPKEIWEKSGRWSSVGEEMFRLKDRKQADLALGMTHEEIFAYHATEMRSYKQLPQLWYQFQTKFRDEARPKSGLLRVREFTMKDSYSFDLDQAGLDRAFDNHFDAYRLPRLQDFIDLGVHEYFAGQGVSIVEWADKVTEALPPERLWIRFELTGPTSRRLTLLPTGEKYDHLVTPISNRER